MKYILIIATFIWVGFIGAISFMEAWVKFQAPLMTVPVGLSIGKVVFAALNKVEWALAILLIIAALVNKPSSLLLLLIPIGILALQTIWLLPALNARADLLIQGAPAPASHIHFYYLFLEVVKILCLFLFGVQILYRQVFAS
jgi:hypothetical protein